MSNKKELGDVMQLIFSDFLQNHDGTKALRRINIAQINFTKRMLPQEAELIGNLKPFFKKLKGVNI